MEMNVKSLIDETTPQTTMVPSSSSSSSSSSSLLTDLSPDIIYTYILTRLDAKSLLALSHVSSELRHLCSDRRLWMKICRSKWPSLLDPITIHTIYTFRGGFRSFFLDASVSFLLPPLYYYYPPTPPSPSELIFALDISFRLEPPFFSKVIYERINNNNNNNYYFGNEHHFRRIYKVNPLSVTSSSVQIDEEAMKEKMWLRGIIMEPWGNRQVNLSFRCVQTKMYPGSYHFVVVYEANKVDEIEMTTLCHVALECCWDPRMNVLCHVKVVKIGLWHRLDNFFLPRRRSSYVKKRNIEMMYRAICAFNFFE